MTNRNLAFPTLAFLESVARLSKPARGWLSMVFDSSGSAEGVGAKRPDRYATESGGSSW